MHVLAPPECAACATRRRPPTHAAVLPHPAGPRSVIAAIEAGDSEGAGRQLGDLLEVALEGYGKDLPPCLRLPAPAPAVMATALLLSHLLTRALAERPFAASDAPAWFEATARLVRAKLQVGCWVLCGWLSGVPALTYTPVWRFLPALASHPSIMPPPFPQEAAASALKDTLQAPAAIMAAVLGASNPVAEVGAAGVRRGRGWEASSRGQWTRANPPP